MSARRYLALGALLAALALPRYATAQPMGTYGFGSRSTAMAGAVSADTSDFSASYYNPAGLVRARTLRIDVGYLYAHHALTTNGRDNQVDPAHGLVGGVVAPGRLFGLPFAFGVALHLPDDRLSRSRSLPQSQPRWELYDNRVQILYIAANLAVAPWPWLRLAGGISFVSSTRGRLDIYGEVAYPTASESSLRHTVDADLTAVRYPQFGVQVDVHPTLTFAAVYRGSYSLRLELDALVSGAVVVGLPTNPNAVRVPGSYGLSSRSTAVFLPQQAVLGGAWRPLPSLTVVADLTWVDWSAYANPSAALTTDLALQIPPDLRGFMLPATPRPAQIVDAGFHDTFVPRVGVEWRRVMDRAGHHTLALRGGYRYDASPVPNQGSVTNFLDSNRHGLSAGAGVTLGGLRPVLGGGVTLDAHADVQLLERRVMRKDDPADPVGDYVLGGTVVSFGATMSAVF